MSVSQKYVLVVSAAPYTHQAADTALQFASALLHLGHCIEQVFFYHDGVYVGSALSSPEQAERNIALLWATLAQTHDVPLVVCSNSAMKRGVLDQVIAAQQDKQSFNLHCAFKLAGLGQFVDAVAKSDKVICFGN